MQTDSLTDRIHKDMMFLKISNLLTNSMLVILILLFILSYVSAETYCGNFSNVDYCEPVSLKIAPFYSDTVNDRLLINTDIKDSQTWVNDTSGNEFICYSAGQRSAICEGYVYKGQNNKVKCDPSFQEIYGCNNRGNSVCYCVMGEWESILINEGRQIVFEGIALFDVYLNVNFYENSFYDRSISDWSNSQVLLSEDNICIQVPNVENHVTLIKKGNFSISSFGNQTNSCFKLPGIFLAFTSNITVEIIDSTGESVFKYSIRQNAYDPCESYASLFIKLGVLRCHTAWQITVWIFCWLGFSLAGILLIFLVIYCLIASITFCCTKFKNVRVKNNMISSSMLIFLLILSVNCQCQSSFFTDSSLTDCLYNSMTGTQDCSPKQIVNIEFPFGQSAVCLNIQDNQNNTIEQIILQQEYVTAHKRLSNQYISCDYQIKTQSVMRCRETAGCRNEMCSDVAQKHPRDGNGQITSAACLALPGETTCLTGVGSPLNGCGLSDSCVYGCYALIPRDQAFVVGELSNFIFTSKLNMCSSIGCLNSTFTVGNSKSTQDLVITFDGFLNGDDISWPVYYNGMHFLDRNPTVSNVSPRGFPTERLIGDVQSDSFSQIENGNFIYDTSIVNSMNVVDEMILYEFLNSGVTYERQTSTHTTLPGNIGPNTWFYDESTTSIFSRLSQPKPSLFTVEFPSNYIISRQISEVCPKVSETTNAIGCYNCTEGFTFNLTAQSTCSEGYADLSCDNIDLANQVIYLYLTESVIEIMAYSSERYVSTDCTIIFSSNGKEHSDSFHIVGELNALQLPEQINQLTVGDTAEISECNKDFLVDVFNGCSTWWKTFLVIILMIFFLILIILTISAILYCLYICCLAAISKRSEKRLRQKLKDMNQKDSLDNDMSYNDKEYLKAIRNRLESGRELKEEMIQFLVDNKDKPKVRSLLDYIYDKKSY